MKNFTFLAICMLCVTVMSLPALAQQQGRGSGGQYMGPGMMNGQNGQGNMMGQGYGRGHMRGYGMYGPGRMGPSQQGWHNMTPEQREKWQQMHSKFMQDTLALRQQLAAKQIELQTLWAQPKPDQDKINKLANEVTGLRSQLSQQQDQFLGSCRQQFGDQGWTCPGMGY